MRQEEPVPYLPVLGMKEYNDANTSLVQNEGCAEGGSDPSATESANMMEAALLAPHSELQ